MGKYHLEIRPSARKELERLSDVVLTCAVSKIEALSGQPRPTGCKKLRGYKDYWRIRIGDYRIVYSIDDSQKIVTVTRIAAMSTTPDRPQNPLTPTGSALRRD